MLFQAMCITSFWERGSMAKMAQSKQRTWIVSMLKRYFETTGKQCVGVRRFHYWLVSLPESQRMIPGKGRDSFRLYRNNRNDYQNIASGHIADARMNDEIPFSCIIDEKNEEIFHSPPSIAGNISICINVPYVPDIAEISMMPDFNDRNICDFIQQNVTRPNFTHQNYHLLIIIEKATAIDSLKRLSNKHGADLLIFSGQASVTRINDAIEHARAKDKPIALFYISDLDVAGWNMPTSCFNRINEIYPNDNILIRVALTREQTLKYNLPPAFESDDKEYSETQKQRFREETGSDICIELDALSEDIIFDMLDTQLSKYSGLSEDEQEYRRLLDCNVDIGYLYADYTALKDLHNSIAVKINKFYIDNKNDIIEYKHLREKMNEVVA